MRRTATILLTLLLTMPVLARADAASKQPAASNSEAVDSMITSFMEKNEVAGMSMAIVQAARITRAAGYGLADSSSKAPVSTNTLFEIGEMRAAFTAVAAMQLVEEGKLELQVVMPLIRSLLTEQLEQLITKASGQSYEDFLRTRQFAPLSMRHTFFAAKLGEATREAAAPAEDGKSAEPVTGPARGRSEKALTPDPRAIYSSASDLSLWDIALAGDTLIKDATLRRLLYEAEQLDSGKTTARSGPWYFPGRPGLMLVTGNGNGFSSILMRFTNREDLLCVTLLANRDAIDLTQLARRIAGAYNPKLGPPKGAVDLPVQQSPYPLDDTIKRLARARSVIGFVPVAGPAGVLDTWKAEFRVWEENGAVWVGLAQPMKAGAGANVQLARSRYVDKILLETIVPTIRRAPMSKRRPHR